jgi:hypothetical protein
MSDDSDYSSLQQPPGGYGNNAAQGTGYGASQNAPSPYGEGALVVAETDDEGSGSGSGAAAPASPRLPGPYPATRDQGLVPAAKGTPLEKCFADLTKKKAFSHLKLALVDLTGAGQGDAPYLGFKDDDLTFVGSIAKIALVLPAFTLRQAARSAAKVLLPAPTPVNFFKQLDSFWDSEFRRGFRGGKARDTKPDLTAILAARLDSARRRLKVDFTSQQNTDRAKAGFLPLLNLALGLSVNEAAALCIDRVGFPYIHEAHRWAGVDGKDGLKLNLDFGGNTWDPSFGGSQSATARWIAELLVLIARDRLVGPGLAAEIADIMTEKTSDLYDGIYNTVTDTERTTLTHEGKIGYLDEGPFNDCAIIRRTSPKGTPLIYVAVALAGKSHDEIRNAAAALDDCILAAHGEPAKPAAAP